MSDKRVRKLTKDGLVDVPPMSKPVVDQEDAEVHQKILEDSKMKKLLWHQSREIKLKLT
jgi:hypothetical protein